LVLVSGRFVLLGVVSVALLVSGPAPAAEARAPAVRVLVVDAQTGKPLQKTAQVVLCERVVEEAGPVVVNQRLRWCEKQLAEGLTKRNGEAALKWTTTAPADLSRASLVVTADGFLDTVVPGSELAKQTGPSRRFRVGLTATARVGGIVTRPDGTPVADAQFGWIAQEGRTLQVTDVSCCSGSGGQIGPENVPPGEVTVFAIEPGASPRLAIARLVAQSGRESKVALEVRQPLVRVHGKVVTSDGASLAAMVSAEPSPVDTASPVDRALLALGNGPTDTVGEFEVLARPDARLTLRASTWTVGQGTESTHVGARPLAELSVNMAARAPAERVVFKVPASKVVACSFTDRSHTEIPIEHLSLTFGPHIGWGHSGGCVEIGRVAGAPAPPADSFRFVWPDGANTVRVWPRYGNQQGEVMLSRPDQPCHVEDHWTDH
jgi:hypothetical protein